MPDTITPTTLDQTLEIKPPKDDVVDIVQDFNGQIEEAIENRSGWRHQLEENFLWRSGQVGKRDPDFPFKGSSDIRFRLSDNFIRQLRSVFVLTLWNAPRMARVTPLNGSNESADKLEHYYNFLYRSKLNIRRTAAAMADKALECGMVVAKITWDFCMRQRTKVLQRSKLDEVVNQIAQMRAQTIIQQAMAVGVEPPDPSILEPTDDDIKLALAMELGWNLKEEEYAERIKRALKEYKEGDGEGIPVVVDEVERNQPDVGMVEELQDIVVPLNTGDIQDAEWVAHDMLFSERELRQDSVEHGGRYRNVDDALERIKAACRGTERQFMQSAIDLADGITSQNEIKGFVRVRELYCWLPKKHIASFNGLDSDDETSVRAVITYCADVPVADVKPLRMIELPYDHGKWPFEVYWFNFSRLRFYSAEGVPELVNAVEQEFNVSRNAAIDRHTLSLSPPTLVWEKAEITPSAFRQVGQVIETRTPPRESMLMPELPDLAKGFNMDAQDMRNWAQEVAGVPNIGALNTMREAPTAAQVERTVAPAQSVGMYDVSLWLEFWARIMMQVHELHRQYMFAGDAESMTIPNMENRQEPVELAPEDFEGDYIIEPGADPSNSNPVLRAQQRFIAFQTAMKFPEVKLMTNLYNMVYALFSDYLGPGTVQQVMKPRGEAEQALQQAQQFAQQQMAMQQAKMAEGQNPESPKMESIPNADGGLVPQ